MNFRFIVYVLGKLLVILAGIMCIPALIAFYETTPKLFPGIFLNVNLLGFLAAIIGSYLTGYALILTGSKAPGGNGIREGFAIVTFGWIVMAFFGSIPLFVYFLGKCDSVGVTEIIRSLTDAYFENMSGFTTTGATILVDIESVPKGLLFWRSLTHWLGGMGIVTLALALFPAFGVAAYQMFRGEVPGPTAERLKPQLGQTAKILWGVYTLLTVAETLLLMFGGMTLFDALCHSFGTMATGGFSTRNASIGAYASAYIDWVVIAFMFFAGMNFILHYAVLFTGSPSILFKDREFHFYFWAIAIAVVTAALFLSIDGINSTESISRSFRNTPLTAEQLNEKVEVESSKIAGYHDRVRHSAFQVISLTTTTGFCTADFDVWPDIVRLGVVVLMFFGGCAGSTGGGIKMVRIMVLLKAAWREVKTMIQPKLISPIKVASTPVEENLVRNILGFVSLFMLLFVIFSTVMCIYIPDVTTAVTSVVATICNIGPGLSGIGATENYAWIPVPGKWILALCMLLGRLEIYTVLIAFAPISWRR